jgi:putative endonuclease
MSFFVYILYSATLDKRYIGQTADLNQRILKHNSGKNLSTKTGIPWVLVAYLNCESRSEAMQIEKKLKNLKSRKRQDEFFTERGFTMQEVIGPEKLQ